MHSMSHRDYTILRSCFCFIGLVLDWFFSCRLCGELSVVLTCFPWLQRLWERKMPWPNKARGLSPLGQ